MLSVTDPALDLLILQLLLHAVLVRLLLFRIRLPVDARPEDDVLAHARGLERRAGGLALLEAEFGPALALGDARVDVLLDDGGAYSAGGLDFFAVVVEAVRYYCSGAVFVGGYLLWGEGGGIVEFFVVGPVGAAVDLLDGNVEGGLRRLTLLILTC